MRCPIYASPHHKLPNHQPRKTGISRARLLRVAILGATGFIGAATTKELTRLGVPTIAVIRTVAPKLPALVTQVPGDLLDRNSLIGLFNAVDVIVHAASYTGPDPDRSSAINLEGTRNLIRSCGTRRIIYISTIGVYGVGPHTAITEGSVEANPATPLSMSRYAAEQLVLQSGGVVIRPGFIYGPGDRWFLPGVAAIHTRLGGLVNEGAAQISVIHIDDVGKVIAQLAIQESHMHNMFHLAQPDPITVHQAATTALPGAPFLQSSLTFDEAQDRAADVGLGERELDLIGRDHWLDSSRIWQTITTEPTTIFPL